MSEYRVPYGKGYQTFSLPDTLWVSVLNPTEVPVSPNPQQAVIDALDNPVGGVGLADFKGATSAVIAVNDKTRPVPHNFLLPPLAQRLEKIGIPRDRITFLIATGTHVPMPADEFPVILPKEIIGRYQVISHDIHDLKNLTTIGITKRGTPITINRRYIETDLRIVVGNIDPHQFMGFSGGVKSAVIGVAGYETIDHNHSMMMDPLSKLGTYDNNPAREDIEEIGKKIGIQFALNAIQNEHKKILNVVSGDPVSVMKAGMPLILKQYNVDIPELFDFIIASPGGHPKDINLYQAQKGLGHAIHMAKEGATVILGAACPEGSGNAEYEEWMVGMTSHEAVLDRFKQQVFHMGPHKAFQFARDISHIRFILVSDIDQNLTRFLLLNPARDIQDAIDRALPDLPRDARVAVVPRASSIVPNVIGIPSN